MYCINMCKLHVSISMSLWSICAFSCWLLFSRIDISRLRVETHSADHLPRSGIVTTISFVGERAGTLLFTLKPVQRCFPSARADRIESPCPISRSLANEFHRARLREWFASTGVYSCSHLLNCDAFMTACRWEINAEAKKDYCYAASLAFRSGRDLERHSNIHPLCSVIKRVQKRGERREWRFIEFISSHKGCQ